MKRFLFSGLAAIGLLLLVPACTSPAATVSTNSTATATSAPSAKPSPTDMVPRITIDELYKKMQSGANILIIDGRSGVETEFEIDHIKGAIPVTLTQFTTGWAPTAPLDEEIIIYCA
jgi:hypothetical protein